MRLQRFGSAIAAAGLLTAAGCGEKRDTTGPVGSSSGTVNISETEFKLAPASAKVASGAVEVKVTNAGSVPHALEIDASGKPLRTAAIAPGKTATLTGNLKAGTYTWFCPIDHHRDMGMKGQIVVGSGVGGSSGGGSSAPSAPGGY